MLNNTQGPVHFDENGIRHVSRLRVLQYRTTYINGTSLLGDAMDGEKLSGLTLDNKLRLVDVAYIEDNGTNLTFLVGSRSTIWPSQNINQCSTMC